MVKAATVTVSHTLLSVANVCVFHSLLALPNVSVCLKVATVPSAQSVRLLDFSFSDFELSDTETTLATIRMFVDLNLVQNFQMKYTVRTHFEMIFTYL